MRPARAPSDRLRDILEAVDHVAEMLSGMDEAGFEADRRTRLAVERSIEIISEASRHIGAEQKESYPDVPWRDIAGIGNVMRHGYDHVLPSVVWHTATESPPELRPVIAALLEQVNEA